MTTQHTHPYYPLPQGLYDPRNEHDACGAGFICSLTGEKSHEVIQRALEILVNLTHRGATGHDGGSGDGAGLLIQVPDRFLRRECAGMGIELPPTGQYATGLVFLPNEPDARKFCTERYEKTIAAEGPVFLGWREVPVDAAVLGESARVKMPQILQIFIGSGAQVTDQQHFERKLYVIRKVVEHAVRNSQIKEKQYFYTVSLSSRTMVYKGLMQPDQIEQFYLDLQQEDVESALAMVHQRYSTNTFPAWPLAQPFRYLCHNGEINTLRGNVNWMNTRESILQSALFGDDLQKVLPVISPGGSDSATLDNVLELLLLGGRSLPHAMLMLIPEAWERHPTMDAKRRAFYEFHACLMEPWDGPAFVPFTDGELVGAVLDRNGLRPARYCVTKKDYVIMASETGVLDVPPDRIKYKGRLEPGKMFLVDMKQGRIISDDEIKQQLAARRPYGEWIAANRLKFNHLAAPEHLPDVDPEMLLQQQKLFGYTQEDLKFIIAPMARDSKEPVGSMGDDTPLAVLSQRPRLLYDYFKQLFAQVTNPPLDAIREELVTSLELGIGNELNLLAESPDHCRLLRLEQPILTDAEITQLRKITKSGIQSETLSITYDIESGEDGLRSSLSALCKSTAMLVRQGITVIILSDRDAGREKAPIPAVLATSAIHHHLIDKKLRTQCALVLESAEPREVHHYCVLLGFGASAINPYLVFQSLAALQQENLLPSLDAGAAVQRYIKATGSGILKVMSKMGISTLQSYQGAQIFEIVGLGDELVEQYFCAAPSPVGGIGLDGIHADIAVRYRTAFPGRKLQVQQLLDGGGKYQWRRDGEAHHLDPLVIAKLQQSARQRNPETYREFAGMVNENNRRSGTLRGLLRFRSGMRQPLPLAEVEPWTEIVKRFKTGAMSFGSLSKEAHETLAIAMNRMGGRSNSGEGGEDAERFAPDADGTLRRSAIKQVASGRFGVTSHYLVNCDEIQIKMAQGAKPGEGGQLPAFKVYPWIAKTRNSTPWVGLISPPPHHDIYSIEDLAQLIFDLKNVNPQARINVKLVSEAGVGTIAAGVAKGRADVVLISGHDGGTGASPLTSLKHAGMPWELGLAETHQTLVLNDLRSRIRVEVDGQLKTGRDVAIAALLGAEEFGFATAPLVAMGCIMMRVCHLNTCPVGIATQDPELREKFSGQPEHVINYFYLVAQELREIMAQLGFRTLDEMVGQTDMLEMDSENEIIKKRGLDLTKLLHKPALRNQSTRHQSIVQNHELDTQLDLQLIAAAKPALDKIEKVELRLPVRNVNRSIGAMLSGEISRRCGASGLPDDTITITFEGSAGQSFGAFAAPGLTMRLFGDANDYFGKGLSGGKLIIAPHVQSTFIPEESIIIGNTALYGGTAGEVYIRGRAGERFAVRNSGVSAVVEGVGDHGCEYMTAGRVVVLGPTGRNFAAGMSGGIAYVLDESGSFRNSNCNLDMVQLEALTNAGDIADLKRLIENHLIYTDSALARSILNYWQEFLPGFVKVMPVEYKKALERLGAERSSWGVERRA